MTLSPLLAATILLLAQQPQNLPTETGPLRNTFVVATETVVDDAAAIDITAEDASYDPLFAQLQAVRTNLDALAEGDREHDIAASAKDLIFMISACRLQAKNGAAPGKCLTQLQTARTRIMQQINHHKSGGLWVDGPPQ